MDIILVSSGFEGISIPERQAQIQKEWRGEEEIQALAYTPEEFLEISKRSTMLDILSYAKDVSPRNGNNICPKCGQPGSMQIKTVRNRGGKSYVYKYFAHYVNGKILWCYVGKP